MKTTYFVLFSALLGALAFYMAPRELQVQSFFAGEISSAPPTPYALLVKDQSGTKTHWVKNRGSYQIGEDIVRITITFEGDEKNEEWSWRMDVPLSIEKSLLSIAKIVVTKDAKGEIIDYVAFDKDGKRVLSKRKKYPRGDIASAHTKILGVFFSPQKTTCI